MSATATATAMVTIPAARLAELEATVDTLKAKLAKRNHVNMDKLITYQKENPEKVLEKKRDYLTRNRAEINARRREAYRKKKEEAVLSAAGVHA
jgi:hypothetical protein